MGVHRRAERAIVRFGELRRVGERAEHADGARRVNRRADLGQGVFRAHRSAPNLRVVQEEQLVVAHVHPW